MADETLSLTYRELAERLAISTDAARMKARRAVKTGRWRIIPGNHPNDPVRVELPVSDIGNSNAIAGEQGMRSTGERKARTQTRTDGNALAVALQSAQDRITQLTDLLTAEKDQHLETSVELARTTVQAEALNAEILRLTEMVEQLQGELWTERRTWWQRIRGR